MSTNPNTQQINVFSKGMNTDTSDAYMSNEQYRYAENLRFVTDESETSGELKLIEGWKYLQIGRNEQTSSYSEGDPIKAVTTVRDEIIILYNHYIEQSGITHARICSWDGQDSEEPKIILDTADAPWGDNISVVTRWESDTVVKLYVADGEHPLMMFNLRSDAPVMHFKDAYQTGGGNIFGGFFKYPDGTHYQRTTGLLAPAIVQYAYVLYTKNGGRSNVSPSTEPISLYSSNGLHKGQMNNPYTNVGLVLRILENTSTSKYNKILVYRITYKEFGQIPSIDLIVDDDLNTDYYEFYDKGQEPIESGTSFAEFVAQDYLEVKPKYIESKNDYLFAGNFEYYSHENIVDKYLQWDATENVSLEIIESKNELTDNHSGPRSLQRGEQYRYGIVLYDKYGTKWPAKWIADKDVPDAYINNPILFEDNKIYTKSLGISVTVKNLDKDNFPKYEIVRAPRTFSDRKTISQGIIGKAMYNNASDDNKYYPSGFITLGQIEYNSGHLEDFQDWNKPESSLFTTTYTSPDLLQFCSPEISYGNYIKDCLDQLSEADILQLDVLYSCIADTKYEKINLHEASEYESTERRTFARFSDSGLYMLDFDNNDQRYFVGSIPFLYAHPEGGKNKSKDDIIIYKSGIEERLRPIQNVIRPNISANLEYKNNETFTLANIKSCKIVDQPEASHFIENDQFEFTGDIVPIGNKTFINWTTAVLEPVLKDPAKLDQLKSNYNRDVYAISPEGKGDDAIVSSNIKYSNYPIATGGRCLIINPDYTKTRTRSNNGDDVFQNYKANSITIGAIRNNSVTPYGGAVTRNTQTYASFGDYFDNDGESHSVFDGDCYIQLFYYNAAHTINSALWGIPQMSTVYIVPIETTIDMNSDYGDSYKRVSQIYSPEDTRLIQTKAIEDLYGYTQIHDAYMYNTAYSEEPMINISSSVPDDDLLNNKFDYRVAYSMQKTNNERYDSWMQFKSADYIDVDTRYGQITNLRLFKDSLLFWQEGATGVVSVNERTMLQDVDDTNIILGNGDVLQRYDYLTTEYGMKDGQMCDAQSNSTLYWWDSYKKDLIAYSGGQVVMPLKRTKQCSKYITSGEEVDHPVLAYDTKYSELIANVVQNYPIVYSELIQQFTGVYGVDFKYKANLLDGLLLFGGTDVKKWNEATTITDEDGKEKIISSTYPLLTYVVNNNHTYVKVFDNVQLGMGNAFYYDQFYNGEGEHRCPITIEFNTVNGSSILDKDITNREYDLRFAIPREMRTEDAEKGKVPKAFKYCGGRMKGRTMQCELTAGSKDTNFSIQYIITKYRISWS